jgi:isopentenyl-diphosphate delta-isomerase
MIENRKASHIDICLKEDVIARHNYWDDVYLIHSALPEINKDEIDLSVKLFGKKLKLPLVISAMTGGCEVGEKINRNLAEAAAEVGVGFGLGSQRPALENKSLIKTYSVVKDYDIPLVIANVGAPQLIKQGNKAPITLEDAREAIEMVDGDILAIHANYLQEIVQPEGDHNSKGCMNAIETLATKVPILIKETGAGISREVALKLKRTKIKGIDVGGLGGTSFAAVEFYRAKEINDKLRETLGKSFWSWGIPTPASIIYASVGLPLIATGGVRNGLDAAKAFVVGADAVGMAKPLLEAAMKSSEEVVNKLNIIVEELRCSMFLLGCKNIAEMHKRKYIIDYKLACWLNVEK